LTADGQRTCQAKTDPETLWARPWDGVWRIVAFDIPETDASLRARLRRKLHEHRFGWLQNSVWISPDPVDEFRALMSEKRLLPESLTLLEARPSGGESNEAMVASAWDFAALDKSHERYLEILRLRPGRLQKPTAWLSWLETEHRAWTHLTQQDPFLPQVLLPRFYRGQAILRTRQEALAAFRTTFS
jgi:phenylacetic acid degradation operon negative regulatory protein